MFSAEVWGTVSGVVEAIGTVAAAVTAVVYYIYESQMKKRAQARQIRAHLDSPRAKSNGHPVTITIRNDSERHISGVYVLYTEDSLARSLFTKARFAVPEIMAKPFTFEGKSYGRLSWNMGGPDIVLKRSKSEIYGFDGAGGLIRPAMGDDRLDSGQERNLDLAEYDAAFYRASRAFWVGFQDADGNLWEIAANREQREGVPRLRSVNSIKDGLFGRTWIGSRVVDALRHNTRVVLWLVRNRGQKTLHEPPVDPDQIEPPVDPSQPAS
jgi:hypothetical protein